MIDAGYDGGAPSSWAPLTTAVALAGTVMAAGLLAYILGLVAVWLGRGRTAAVAGPAPAPVGVREASAAVAWTGPLALAVLLAAMYGATAAAFELLRALPITAAGGAGH